MIDSLLTSLKNCSSQGQLSEAFKIFSLLQLQLQLQHVSSTNYSDIVLQSVSTLLTSCTKLHSLAPGKQIHSQIIISGFERNPSLVPKVVSFYSAFNLLADAHIVTEHSNVLHTLPWNLLVFAYVKNGLFAEALSAYKQMVNKGIRADNFTFPAVLKACGEISDADSGREVHKSIEASSQPWSLFVHNALVAMYSRFGFMDTARRLFDEMPEKDAISCNTMISAYASKGMWSQAFELFESLCNEEGTKLSIITWNTIAGGLLRTGDFTRAIGLIPRTRDHGVQLDSVALMIGLGACSHVGAIRSGKEIHGFATRRCLGGPENFRNALITMYSRCRDLSRALTTFRLIENKNIITWNSMLSGYAHMDRSEEASLLFREMVFSGIEPSYVTIASVLPLCARAANLQLGKEFHCYILRRERFGGHLLLWNSIVDMYARSGKVLEAKRVFDLLTDRDEVTYTSIIAGYGIQGEGRKAVELFEEMSSLGIRPDRITMVAVLSACSHSGLVAQGRALFGKMQSGFGISPLLEHYSCMVDLYGRAGLIREAKAAVVGMPWKPTPGMWAALIGACRIHGDLETGQWAAENLLEMGPRNSGYYVLIANMYAAAGSWDRLAAVRSLMRNSGVRKDPGSAWVQVGSGFVSFLVGDVSNPRWPEIYCLLDGLAELMKDEGYITTPAVEQLFED